MVALKCDEEIIDTITYPHNSQLPDEGQVLARYNDTWHISTTPTPETVNVISQVVTLGGNEQFPPKADQPMAETTSPINPSIPPSQLKIPHPTLSELYPNPPGSDALNEYIELFNPHDEGMNLSGYILEDSFGTQYVMPSLYLGPKQYISFDRATTGIALDNDKEKVTLKDVNAKTVEYAYINKPLDEHSSLQKIQNKWVISILPTKNSANILVEPNVAPTIEVKCTGEEKIGQLITCDASDSIDKNKDLLFFEWQLQDSDMPVQRFHTDQLEISISHPGTYQILLTVSDGKMGSVWKKEIKIQKSEDRSKESDQKTEVSSQESHSSLKAITCPENNYDKITITDVVAFSKTISGDEGFMMGNPAREILTNTPPPALNTTISLQGTVRCKQNLPRIHMTSDTLQLISENTPFIIQSATVLPDELGSIVSITGAYKQKTRSGFMLQSDEEIQVNTKLLGGDQLTFQENTPLNITGLVWKIGENVVLMPRFRYEIEEVRSLPAGQAGQKAENEKLTIQKQKLPPWNLVGVCVSGLLLLLGIFMRTRTQGPPRLITEESKRSRFIK
ncbi:lamin tail domain-containing protein [Candidatus Falkowbacteria bacterium]|nr:lamin tail domain-containing protein [Candidatus Falkowbacteria bacterium]